MSSYSQTPAARDNIVKIKRRKYQKWLNSKVGPSVNTCQQARATAAHSGRMRNNDGSWPTPIDSESWNPRILVTVLQVLPELCRIEHMEKWKS